MGPEVRAQCPVGLVEDRRLLRLGLRARRAEERQLPRNHLHYLLNYPLPIRIEVVEPGRSLGLRGGNRKGILARG